MKKNRNIIIIVLLCLIPILWGSFIYKDLPNMLPTHFDFNGVPDKYSTKFMTIYGFSSLFALASIFMYFFTMMVPKKIDVSNKGFIVTIAIMPLLANLMPLISIFAVLGYEFNTSKIVMLILSIFFIILGNYMPKITRNYVLGIRTPWTLDNDVNWKKTHKFAGFCLVILGILGIIQTFIKVNYYVILTVFLIFVLLPTIYSFYLYITKKDQI